MVEGRLMVERVAPSVIGAACRGNGGVYRLGYSSQSGWWCECAARGECSHLVALKLVTVTTTASVSDATSEGGR